MPGTINYLRPSAKDLGPDIDVMRRAIERLVGSLTSKPGEQVAIILAGAFESIARTESPELCIGDLRFAVSAFRSMADDWDQRLKTPRFDGVTGK